MYPFETIVALAGMLIGLILLLVARHADVPKELRVAGLILLVGGFCFLLRLQVPGIWSAK